MTYEQEKAAASTIIKTDKTYPSNQVVDYYLWSPGDENDLSNIVSSEGTQAWSQAIQNVLGSSIFSNNQFNSILANALNYFAGLTNLSFNNVDKSGLVSVSGQQDPYLSFATIDRGDGSNNHATITLQNSQNNLIFFDRDGIGDLSYWHMLHELGHALGLTHPHDVQNYPDIYDNQKYTIMSYRGHPSSNTSPATLPGGLVLPNVYIDVVPTTLMILDYLAFRQMGLLTNPYNNGVNIYTFDSEKVLQTLYDTGGIDTFSLADQSRGGIIDLRQGHFSSVGRSQTGGGGTAVQNVGIAYGTVIENAIGSDEEDVIIGNAYNNVLRGGEDDDIIYGDGTSYNVDDWGFSADHKDEYRDEVGAEYTDPGNTPPVSDNDILYGEDGDDKLYGGEGNDLLVGGDDEDTLEAGEGDDTLIGGDVAGQDDSDDDTLRGGNGFDTYYVGNGDVIEDSDRQGRAFYNYNIALSGIRNAGDPANTYQSLDGFFTYTQSGNTLTVQVNQGGPAGFVINNFTNGALGIQLRDLERPAELETVAGGADNDWIWLSTATHSNVSDADNPNDSGISRDHPVPVGLIQGFAGDDLIFVDPDIPGLIVEGGAGEDFIEVDRDRFANGTPAPDTSNGVLLYGEAGSDFVSGSQRNDFLDGGTEGDAVYGNGGDDLVLGREGNDWLDGNDSRAVVSSQEAEFRMREAA